MEKPRMKYPKTKGLVSIIIPIYNDVLYLRDCLDSVLVQTFTNWEAILVNDCSTDDTGKIIDEYVLKDSRFKAINKKINEGTLLARKTGLENSKGEYIANLDHDDKFHPDFLEKMFDKVSKSNADFAWCNTKYIIDNNDYIWNENRAINVDFVFYPNGFKCFLWNKLIKREIYEQVEFPKLHLVWGEDPLQMLQIAYHSKYAVQVPEYLYDFREESSTSATRTRSVVSEEKARVDKIIAPFLWLMIFRKFFGNSQPININFDGTLKNGVSYYNGMSRETRIKYGIEGLFDNISKDGQQAGV